MREAIDSKSDVEVADILRAHLDDYLLKYNIPIEHLKIINDIIHCRTSFFGGHLEQCDNCGHEHPAYNSCRNRHCPKCQTITKEKWLEARKSELLPIFYFHNVFTLPHDLNPVVLCNKRVMLRILFKSVSETLLQFGKNPENGLGGKLGIISLLHTWDQKLNDHFHLHCLVPGGALSFDGSQWISCKHDFLFPVAALSKVFRGKFIDYLKKSFKEDELIFPGNTETFGTAKGFEQLLNKLWAKDWVVYIKDPIKKPEKVLEYFGRYTHRIAISNHRIVALENGKVTFTYRNRETGDLEKETIAAVEFIRRFLLHALPSGFMRIRHFGFLANRYKKDNIKKCRELLGVSTEVAEKIEKSAQEMMLELTGVDIKRCPCCKKGTMKVVAELPREKIGKGLKMLRSAGIKDSS